MQHPFIGGRTSVALCSCLEKVLKRHGREPLQGQEGFHVAELAGASPSTQQNGVVPGTARPEINPGLYHNVSNTLTARDGEWDDVAEYIWENRADFTGISMLAASGDKLYQQAPHKEVVTVQDETRWNELIANFRPAYYILRMA